MSQLDSKRNGLFLEDEIEDNLADAEVLIREVLTQGGDPGKIRDLLSRVGASAGESVGRFKAFYKDRPYWTLLAAGAAGMLAGYLLTRGGDGPENG
jgi:hypothetical protein